MSGFEESIIVRGLISNFMDSIQVLMEVYGEFDPHALGLLSMAEYKQRISDIKRIARIYTRRKLAISRVDRLMSRNEDRIQDTEALIKSEYTKKRRIKKKGKTKTESVIINKNAVQRLQKKIQIWGHDNLGNHQGYELHLDMILRCESWFAKYRNIALAHAFRQFQKDSSQVLGVPEDQMKKVKKSVEEAKKKYLGVKDRYPRTTRSERSEMDRLQDDVDTTRTHIKEEDLSEDQREKMERAGIDPSDIFS